MKSVQIINVAGLLIDGKDDGIERAIRSKLNPRSLVTVAPTPPGAAFEHPDAGILRLIAMIRESIQSGPVILVGRSYGAFMALMAAVRMDFEKILKVILIEGPLNPDVTVVPPALLVPLLACGSHYDARPELAQEAAAWLEANGSDKLVIIQGGAPDAVVENSAQIIPGAGKIFRLSPHLTGKKTGFKKVWPEGYRNHLFWTDEKMDEVMGIIAAESEESEVRAAADF